MPNVRLDTEIDRKTNTTRKYILYYNSYIEGNFSKSVSKKLLKLQDILIDSVKFANTELNKVIPIKAYTYFKQQAAKQLKVKEWCDIECDSSYKEMSSTYILKTGHLWWITYYMLDLEFMQYCNKYCWTLTYDNKLCEVWLEPELQ